MPFKFSDKSFKFMRFGGSLVLSPYVFFVAIIMLSLAVQNESVLLMIGGVVFSLLFVLIMREAFIFIDELCTSILNEIAHRRAVKDLFYEMSLLMSYVKSDWTIVIMVPFCELSVMTSSQNAFHLKYVSGGVVEKIYLYERGISRVGDKAYRFPLDRINHLKHTVHNEGLAEVITT